MSSELKYLIVKSSSAAKKIVNVLKEELFDTIPKELLEVIILTELRELFEKKLNKGLYCFIEFPYVDKIYRDSYYSYYSSKHLGYKRDCVRVSLFSRKTVITEFLNSSCHQKLDADYLGYFILRPLHNAVFGRSLISPKAFKANGFKICHYESDTLVFGAKLGTNGFPHSSQDGETISCAETTVWALMDYFSTKYSDYQPTLPSTILKTLEAVSYERQLPSNGLSMKEISFALRKFGFGPRIYSARSNDLYSLTQTYLESGIPIVLGLKNDSGDGHATIAIGKKYSTVNFKKVKKRRLKIDDTEEVEYFDTSDFNDKIVIQDDNLFPYEIVDFYAPGKPYNQGDEARTYQIDSIIAPLYPKIYLEAFLAKELAKQIISDGVLGTELMPGFILRFFLTSSRSFKNHISNLSMPETSKFDLISIKMPKFIWCAELYKKVDYLGNKEAFGLVLIDATEADMENYDALIYAGYPDNSLCQSDGQVIEFAYGLEKYTYFSNLK